MRAARAKPARAKPARAKPARAKVARGKPARAEPARRKPARAKAVRARPAGGKPARAKRQAAPNGEAERVEKVLARVAHDVRTPLSALLMWVRLLRSGELPDPAPALAAIEESARELSDTIEALTTGPTNGKAASTKADRSVEASAPPAKKPQKTR